MISRQEASMELYGKLRNTPCTHSKAAQGLNGKISQWKYFIWYPLVVCVTTGVNCFSDEEDPELPDYDIKEIVAAWKEFVKDKEKQKKKKQAAAAAAAAEESFDYDLTGPRGTGPRCGCYYHCHVVNFLFGTKDDTSKCEQRFKAWGKNH